MKDAVDRRVKHSYYNDRYKANNSKVTIWHIEETSEFKYSKWDSSKWA